MQTGKLHRVGKYRLGHTLGVGAYGKYVINIIVVVFILSITFQSQSCCGYHDEPAGRSQDDGQEQDPREADGSDDKEGGTLPVASVLTPRTLPRSPS